MTTWVIGNANGSIGAEVQGNIVDCVGTGTDVDVRDWGHVDRFIRTNGPFENVVYCAGIASLQWIPNLKHSEVSNVFAVNVFGFINVMSSLMRHQPEGNVVALISDSSHVAMRGSMAYCSSKAALHQAVRVAAREGAPGFRVNGVSPSAVDGTRMTEWIDETVPTFRGWDKTQAREYELSGIPLGRRASKEEVSQVILDILFGPAAMTGTIVEITGGK